MAGTPEHVLDAEEDDLEEQEMGTKEKADDDVTSEAGSPSDEWDGEVEIVKQECKKELPTVLLDDTDDEGVDDCEATYVPPTKPSKPDRKRRAATGKKQQPKTYDVFEDVDPSEESSLKRRKVKIEDTDVLEVYTFEVVDDVSKMADTMSAKTYDCTLCDFKGVKSKNLSRHMMIHTGEKPYSCSICDRKFIQSTNLTTHMRVHTKEKPYACEFCDFRSAQITNMKRHVQTHTGEKTYECASCGYKCIQANDMKRHIKCHTGEKTYACDQCDYTCIQSATLKNHKKHHHEKTFACSSCDYKCFNIRLLTSHKKIHSTRKYYSCDLCEYKTHKPSDLAAHKLKRSHNEVRIGRKHVACDVCDFKCSSGSDLYKHKKIHAEEAAPRNKRKQDFGLVKLELPTYTSGNDGDGRQAVILV